MSEPCWHSLLTALGNLYTMLTVDRGLQAESTAEEVLSQIHKVQMLPMDGDAYRAVGDRLFELNLLQADAAKSFDANKLDPDWIALHTRLLMFAQPTDRKPRHAAIDYSIVFVVVTLRSGDATNKKMQIAQVNMLHTIDELKRAGLPVTSGRLVRLVYGNLLKQAIKTEHAEHFSTEVWFTQELHLNPTRHIDVPLHVPYAELTPEQLAEIPEPLRKAAETSKMKLAVLLPTDIIARWYGFVVGQIVCTIRRHKLEGGQTYNIRFVR